MEKSTALLTVGKEKYVDDPEATRHMIITFFLELINREAGT